MSVKNTWNEAKTFAALCRPMTDDEVLQAARDDPDAQPMTDVQLTKTKRISTAKLMRIKLRLTQEQFAERFQIPVGTLRDWEQGKTEPDAPARAYLRAIAGNAEAVVAALEAAPRPAAA